MVKLDKNNGTKYTLAMPLIKTEKQKDNLAKFSYDIAKIILAITVVGPIAKPETFHFWLLLGGLVVSVLFFIFAYQLDGKEVII
mgnify:FL=1